MTEAPPPVKGSPSPWARPVPGQTPPEVGLASPTPEVLETPRPAPGPAVAAPGAAVGGWPAAGPLPGPQEGIERHPADPDETPSTKAWAVLALGVVGLLLMFCGGGLAPGLAGLALVRPARAELTASAGFLTGGRALRAGEIMSWIAVAVSAIVIVAVVIGLLIGSVGNGPQYDENVN
ncbi:hypothetical protein [Cryptosporangium aurantiacum]|uniref:DUF4190 domain-containing protein n=1 Tax=Cryptosporangium aurantiacum TaxID=134849 RepID=A0A1M7QWS6_9ACTN|nr:hypothetical protein [Cryptosporangium aurantiacum]SHN36471.1 hypothetical protein SAMN05443668_105528 [Cryptosporangium aurantiacum]